MNDYFQNKVAIITGGGTGIGKETARTLLAAGAKVLINGRRESVLAATAKELDPSGRSIAFVAGDAGSKAVAAQVAAAAVERFGGIDLLVNSAGIFKPTPFLDHTEADVDAYLAVAIKAPFFAAQAVIPEMLKRGGGSIVNVGSMWATIAVGATPSSAYSAGKAGLHALTRNLAIEFCGSKIRANAVAPAVVETPVYDTFLTPEQRAEILPTFNGFHPLGRNGQPADVVEAILFLAAAEWITGVVMPVDGGVTAGLHNKS